MAGVAAASRTKWRRAASPAAWGPASSSCSGGWARGRSDLGEAQRCEAEEAGVERVGCEGGGEVRREGGAGALGHAREVDEDGAGEVAEADVLREAGQGGAVGLALGGGLGAALGGGGGAVEVDGDEGGGGVDAGDQAAGKGGFGAAQGGDGSLDRVVPSGGDEGGAAGVDGGVVHQHFGAGVEG